MSGNDSFDVIIIGGSYSGLAAGMALGRALKKVLIIDSGKPCNRQTPYSHNFLTRDGVSPTELAALARQQVQQYQTINFFEGLAISGSRNETGFEIKVETGKKFKARKLVFATGVRDLMPGVPGYEACWGISLLHCPYCHGYEVRNKKTGIIGNGEYGHEFSMLISNWTKDLTLFTDGISTLTAEQTRDLEKREIQIIEKKISRLEHSNGQVQQINFTDGSKSPVDAVYVNLSFEQHCQIPASLGCELSPEGYIKVDTFQETTVNGIFACGDNTTRLRTVANAVAMGTTAGMTVSKKLIFEDF